MASAPKNPFAFINTNNNIYVNCRNKPKNIIIKDKVYCGIKPTNLPVFDPQECSYEYHPARDFVSSKRPGVLVYVDSTTVYIDFNGNKKVTVGFEGVTLAEC
jgi:hypothetical protein